ncbi:MAG: hypothetical protein P1P83_12485 [Bacteroidales bacterium]|nr:hypothetical protein [Bacteroidales bacterium]MDT8374718.1 hypothetical protein [Bacteroidales bacterium]
MKADIGISSYPVKVAGVTLSAISLVGFIIFTMTGYDPAIIDNMHLTKLLSILFACGLVLFLFSKDKNDVDAYIHTTNMVSRYFLTALYSTLIAFSLVQSLKNDFYDFDIVVFVIFFLILQVIYTVVLRLRDLSNKGFYIFSTVIFVAGLIILLLL